MWLDGLDPAKVVAVFTVVLAGTAAVQAWVYWRQAKIMEKNLNETRRATAVAQKSAEAARNGAMAATMNADANMQAERAYVALDLESPRLEFPLLKAEEVFYGSPQDGRRLLTFRFTIRNYGNTPATVERVAFGYLVSPTFDESLDLFNRRASSETAFLVKNAHIEIEGSITVDHASHVSSIRRGDTHLWIRGGAEYVDRLGQRHRAEFALVYDPEADDEAGEWLGSRRRNNCRMVVESGGNFDTTIEPGTATD